ncbi:hypothetical protein [Methylobacterium sp. E-025]|uniref:hypothetical protein n=1 Tax=Methylobacterium sp. E-025 TaxID=2836561 RepID=UPI001FBA30F3|nr:hypothetical protein [Methylobacterium sp. E-025]
MVHAAVMAAAILAEPGLAAAQARRPDPGLELGGQDSQYNSDTKAMRNQLQGGAKELGAAAAPAPVRKAARPEKTFGPDLAAFVAAPVGVIVTPINAGLRAFDAAMAPLNDALRPITGPLVLAPPPTPVPVPVGPGK